MKWRRSICLVRKVINERHGITTKDMRKAMATEKDGGDWRVSTKNGV